MSYEFFHLEMSSLALNDTKFHIWWHRVSKSSRDLSVFWQLLFLQQSLVLVNDHNPMFEQFCNKRQKNNRTTGNAGASGANSKAFMLGFLKAEQQSNYE